MERFKLHSWKTASLPLVPLAIGTFITLLGMELLRGWSDRNIYNFMDWDMFLAWVPSILALLLKGIQEGIRKQTAVRRVLIGFCGAAWLLFYPNAAYLISSTLHPFIGYRPEPNIRFTFETEFWMHLLLFFSAALIGVLLSYHALLIIHQLIKQTYGKIAGWIGAIVILMLSSFGIYVGRFVRWNSWDVLNRPIELLQQSWAIMTDIEHLRLLVPFTGLILMCTLVGYASLFGLARMIRQMQD